MVESAAGLVAGVDHDAVFVPGQLRVAIEPFEVVGVYGASGFDFDWDAARAKVRQKIDLHAI